MELDFSILLKFADALALGLWTTLKLTVLCVTMGTALGFLIGLARASENALIRIPASAFVEFFRGTPVIV